MADFYGKLPIIYNDDQKEDKPQGLVYMKNTDSVIYHMFNNYETDRLFGYNNYMTKYATV